jgi:hypothetical protein
VASALFYAVAHSPSPEGKRAKGLGSASKTTIQLAPNQDKIGLDDGYALNAVSFTLYKENVQRPWAMNALDTRQLDIRGRGWAGDEGDWARWLFG